MRLTKSYIDRARYEGDADCFQRSFCEAQRISNLNLPQGSSVVCTDVGEAVERPGWFDTSDVG